MDTNDQFTRRDAKADTSDIPVVTGADLADERARRAMSYRERQRQESQRRAKEAAARGETYAENPYINSRRQTGGVSYDRFDIPDNFEEEARRSAAHAASHPAPKKAASSAKTTVKEEKEKKRCLPGDLRHFGYADRAFGGFHRLYCVLYFFFRYEYGRTG